MKLFKSLFSIALACALILSIGITALAGGTCSLGIPDGFTAVLSGDSLKTWKSSDGSTEIELAISANTSNVKVNPNDAGESYMALIESEMTATVTGSSELSGEVVAINSSVMELGEHDAIRTFMHSKYTFKNGEMSIYQVCYLFETQNYVHALVVTGDEDISAFSDELIRTMQINDEAIPLRQTSTSIPIFVWAIIGAGVGALIGVALAIIKKIISAKAQRQSTPTQPEQTEQ